MRFLIARLRVPAALVLTLVVCTGCPSAPSAAISDAEVVALLDTLRTTANEPGAWEAVGRGRMLQSKGTARLVADHEGRYRLQLEAPLHYAEVHDGSTTSKLYPWGSVLDIESVEEEMSLIPMWVATGYWLSPQAPVVISAGKTGRKGDVVALEVRHRDGRHPFELFVDTVRGAPISIQAAIGARTTVVEMNDHRVVNGRPVPGSIRWLNHGRAIVEMEFDRPEQLNSPDDVWARPQAVSRATYDREISPRIESHNDGRGFLFVRPVINGRRMGWFLFDTGAPASMLGKTAVKKLGLEPLGDAESSGVGGTTGISIHAVDSIQLGPVKLEPVFLASMDVLSLGWRDLPIEGVVGCDLIARAMVEYDIRSGSIIFNDPATYELPAGASWQRIVLIDGKPVVTVPFEDHQGQFQVDTAAGGTFSISKPLVDRLDLLKDRMTRDSEVTGVGGGVTMQRGTVRWLRLGGKRYEGVTTRFAVSDQGSYATAFPDGIVGINLIDDFRVVFDLANKRMAFLDRPS